MIDLKSYLTASGSYPDRESHKELTSELLKNAEKLLQSVNEFLKELAALEKINTSYKVSSGFRPSEVNSATPNAAKRSLHMQGLAIDLSDDKNQTLAKACQKHPNLLKKYELFLESPDHTKGKHTNWCHLDCSPTRKDRPSRVFIP